MPRNRTLSSAPRSVKQWKKDLPPKGHASPDPMPGTQIRDLEGKSRRELEEKLAEVEEASCRMSDLIHDELGLKLFMRYLGTAMLGATITLAVTEVGAPLWLLEWLWLFMIIALLFLVYGFMGQRQTDKTIAFDARGHDRERIIRALDRAIK